MRRILFLAVALLQLGGTAIKCDEVPVFLWTTRRTLSFPEVFAGHTVTDQEFSDDFLQRFLHSTEDEQVSSDRAAKNPHILAVFLQDEMCLQELTRKARVFNATVKGAVFAHLRSIMATTNSKFLPSVSSVYESLMSLINEDTGTDSAESQGVDLVEISNPSELPIMDKMGTGQAGKIVYIIHVANSASPREIDDLIGQVDRKLISLGRPYSAIYTGRQSSLSRPQVLEMEETAEFGKDISSSKAGGRKLQSTVYYPTTYMFINITNCLYLYAQNVTLSVAGQGSWNLPLDAYVNPAIGDSTFCSNYSAELSLTYSNVDDNLREVNLTMIFGVTQKQNAGSWLMTNFTVSYAIFNNTWFKDSVEMWPFFITETPYSFSYSCYHLPPISPLHSMDGLGNKTVNVTFTALQVQAFNITNNQFGYYNDCVGFFTIMTWAVLIVLFIMVGILFFAACMFSGLSTQDRYEDAHGKALIVNALE